jgi:alpha-1,3/alpha-1,6-mannosyltransferase
MSSKIDTADSPRIVFIHPDLGIGGAERLVVDAAVGLQARGAKVTVLTSHCDPRHCFDEARDGTLDVRVRGGSIVPRALLGRLTILCAILRQVHLILQVYLSGELAALRPTYFFVDQLSAGLPLLRYLCPEAPVLFYCHFPDLLLAHGKIPKVGGSARKEGDKPAERQKLQSNLSTLSRLYRAPFDALESWSMSFAAAIAVNSGFTKSIVETVWPSLGKRVDLRVVYPCVAPGVTDADGLGASEDVSQMWAGDKVILSINRFERKKDVGLAIRAFAAIPEEKRRNSRLVIAGGYDPRVHENVSYHSELEELAASLSLDSQTHTTLPSALAAPPSASVIFLHSVPTASKLLLLRRASLLVYTPENEHFGIVPLEAMAAHLPVLAATSGGPTETVVEGEMGWLRDTDDVGSWADVMGRILGGDISDEELQKMGRAGATRVREGFERDAMSARLQDVMREMDDVKRPPPSVNVLLGLAFVLAIAVGMAVSQAVLVPLANRFQAA